MQNEAGGYPTTSETKHDAKKDQKQNWIQNEPAAIPQGSETKHDAKKRSETKLDQKYELGTFLPRSETKHDIKKDQKQNEAGGIRSSSNM